MLIKQRDERACRAVKKYGETLWHYTDAKALNGIINTREIWFGSTSDMNDKEELNGFICDLKREVFKEITKENIEKANAVFEKIANRLTMEYPFVFCVSKAHDDAAQWERYADGGKGFAVIFNTELLFKLIFNNNYIMNEEYYGYNAKQHQMKSLLVDYIQEDIFDEFSDLDGLIDNLLLCAMMHKHESFRSEQEVRLYPLIVKANDQHFQYKIMSTIRKVYIMDLDELCIKENIDIENLIDSIIVGPKSQQNIEDLKWYCKQIGLSQLANKIYKSTCPLR